MMRNSQNLIVLNALNVIEPGVYERMYFDELSDEEADYYNERIRHFENGDYSGTRKVDLNALKK